MNEPAWQRVGCRRCDQVFGIETPASLSRIPCAYCAQVGHLMVLPIPGTWPADLAARGEADAQGEGGGDDA